MTDKKKRYTSNPRVHRVGLRLTDSEKELLDRLSDKLGLTITDTFKEGLKALDEKYRLIKD